MREAHQHVWPVVTFNLPQTEKMRCACLGCAILIFALFHCKTFTVRGNKRTGFTCWNEQHRAKDTMYQF